MVHQCAEYDNDYNDNMTTTECLYVLTRKPVQNSPGAGLLLRSTRDGFFAYLSVVIGRDCVDFKDTNQCNAIVLRELVVTRDLSLETQC